GVRTFQAEDEIAAITSTIGAAFGGAMAITTSSGPGIALKGEGMGLGMILELPMIIVNVQRGGPSTGLPTKTEQSDLLQAFYGRNGECPLPIVAPCSPSDCFEVGQIAWEIAVRSMVPVMILSDGYIANGAEPWRIPDPSTFDPIPVTYLTEPNEGENFLPNQRDDNLARPWALPGTPGLEHRIGGLEKEENTGNVCYDPMNHQRMTEIRQRKVDLIAEHIPHQAVDGPEQGDVLVLGWGGTYGALATAAREVRNEGGAVAHAHLRYLNPFPANLGELLTRYKKVLIPELNMGQLSVLIRSKYLIDAVSLNKVQGKPFAVAEVAEKIRGLLKEINES
ncbi:MAG: 2-oxoglutarate ferredoxin oxidoreductase subunit alpha, partial [Planctomycetales bacterium]